MNFFLYFVIAFSGPCVSKKNKQEDEIDRIVYYSSVVNGWLSFALERTADILSDENYLAYKKSMDPQISEIFIRINTFLKILKGELSSYDPDIFPKQKLLLFNIVNSITFNIDLYKELKHYIIKIAELKSVLIKFCDFDIRIVVGCGKTDLEDWTLMAISFTQKCIKEIENLEVLLTSFEKKLENQLGVKKERYRRISSGNKLN